VQLLPGRLEALEGPPGNPEIRFFRISSMEVPEITFGRSEGPTYRHVQLFAPTVSRTHARIRFVERRWTITNLSAVNPVVVNDVELRGEGEEQTLSDGDVVQIGEYVFRYRDKG
jgi:pSer/pThr/pTyr-binding forkhead associated (FHA) protein